MTPVAQSGLVFLGGGIGATLRFWAGLWIRSDGFPYATFAVNLIGSIAIGVFIGFGLKEPWRLLIVVGLLGGFTTFSSFSAECLTMLQQRAVGQALMYAAASVILCVLGAWIGFGVTKL